MPNTTKRGKFCPRKSSYMSPCPITDLGLGYADDGLCVTCWLSPKETGVPYNEPWHGRRRESAPDYVLSRLEPK